jgi:AcrR family transcriptional regulator
LLHSLRQAFFDFGYETPTMVDLAKACGVTRRTLYNHCVNKTDAFRAILRWRHGIEIAAGMDAGRHALAAGCSVLDAAVAIMDTRYGEARRDLGQSAHAVEINYAAFRYCREVMIASAVDFQTRLADWLAELAADGQLRLREGVTALELAQLLADGARGVNQSLPPLPAAGLPARYRRMFAAILHGCLAPEENQSRFGG